MKTSTIFGIALCIAFVHFTTHAQKTISEYVTKNDSEKIQKKIISGVFTEPTTVKSFRDGHGITPYLTSKNQLPDTIALVTFTLRDLGDVHAGGNVISYTWVSSVGGNKIMNLIHEISIEKLKAKFKEYGVVLLTPEEFLDTPEKRKYYYEDFIPEVSKLGNFMSRMEDRGTQMVASANYYRTFLLSAAFDFKRCVSLGYDLTNKLGVDGVLSIGVAISTNNKEGYFRSMKMALHGPNPIPKEDKKYAAQKAGNGYNAGLLYMGQTFTPKKPFQTLSMKKKKITAVNFDGIDVIMVNFIDKMYTVMYDCIEKNQK